MPAKVTQTNVLSQLGDRLRNAFEKHKNDQTDYGQVELPAGIDEGRAELVSCGFGVFKNGEFTGQPYFRAAAVVKFPDSVTENGLVRRCAGLQTSIGPEPICDTPKRESRPKLEDHVGWVLNELRKIVGDEAIRGLDISQLEPFCASLIDPKNPIFIKFRTWKGQATPQFPNPRVNHQWLGSATAEEMAGLTGGGGMTDESAEGALPKPPAAPARNGAPAANGAHAAVPSRPATVPTAAPPARGPSAPSRPSTGPSRAPAPAPVPPPPPPAAEPPGGAYSDADTAQLGEAADNGDESAIQMLTEMAMTAGMTEEQITNVADWKTLAGLLLAGGEPASADAGDGADGSAGGEWSPEVEQIYLYKPKGPGGRPAAKAVEVEVVGVDAAAQTVDLKNLANPKAVYKGVPWAALESADS